MLKVLVIDDSAFSRFALKGMLDSMPGVKVAATAVDGVDGYAQAVRHEPDLIILDLEMPNMDGFTFLRLLNSSRQIPVIVVSGQVWEKGALKAFELGAFDYLEKPSNTASAEIFSLKEEIAKRIKRIPSRKHPPVKTCYRFPDTDRFASEAVAIGASTGGPKAVSSVLKALPAEIDAAVLVSIHMPAWLTRPFVARLADATAVKVKAAEEGEAVEKGAVYIAPGGRHMSFERKDDGVFISLKKASYKDLYAPSVDIMFKSAAKVWGAALTGIVMTGMGQDGMEGIAEIKRRGGVAIAESRESSFFYSMPEAAISTGLLNHILHSDEIGLWIVRKYRPEALKRA